MSRGQGDGQAFWVLRCTCVKYVRCIPSGLGGRRSGGSLYSSGRFFIIKLNNTCVGRRGADYICIIPGDLLPSIGIMNFVPDMARTVWRDAPTTMESFREITGLLTIGGNGITAAMGGLRWLRGVMAATMVEGPVTVVVVS